MSDVEPVTLDPATRDESPILANLLELHIHDLSQAFALEPGPDGRFGYDRLPSYWQEPTLRFPFLIRRASRVVGFALATRGSPVIEDPEVLDVAEFFVLRRHRRSGVGTRAAFLLWDRMPGRWIVRVAQNNLRGLPFWRAAVSAYTGGHFREHSVTQKQRGWQVFTLDTPRPEGARGDVGG